MKLPNLSPSFTYLKEAACQQKNLLLLMEKHFGYIWSPFSFLCVLCVFSVCCVYFDGPFSHFLVDNKSVYPWHWEVTYESERVERWRKQHTRWTQSTIKRGCKKEQRRRKEECGKAGITSICDIETHGEKRRREKARRAGVEATHRNRKKSQRLFRTWPKQL